jgi:hypothetical protein
VREEINPVEADVIRDAAMRVLEHGNRPGRSRGTEPAGHHSVAAKQWWPTSIVGTLTSAWIARL